MQSESENDNNKAQSDISTANIICVIVVVFLNNRILHHTIWHMDFAISSSDFTCGHFTIPWTDKYSRPL